MIASPATFGQRIIGHPFKYESHRLGLERSEDTLSWNTMRSLEEADLLWKLASHIVGETIRVRPFLFLWGICTTNDDFEPWDLLIEARREFESNLPVERPLTEPDIALFLPGRYVILIEAKFCSPNTAYQRGPRKNGSSLTLDELLGIYQFSGQQFLDIAKATQRQRVFYQLWRNMTFAEWMAKLDHPSTKAYHVNLVREGYERESAAEFAMLVPEDRRHHFQRLTWEEIHNMFVDEPAAATLTRYLETKTAGLMKPAFALLRA